MNKNKTKIINYTIKFDSEGNFDIKLHDNIKLTKRQINQMASSAGLQYQMLLKLNEKQLNELLVEESQFFDENSSGGFFGGKPKLDGLTKEEYLENVRINFIKSHKTISMDGQVNIEPLVNVDELKGKEAEDMKNLINNTPIKFDSEGNLMVSNPLKLYTTTFEIPAEVAEENDKGNDFGLLGKPKKKHKKT